MAKFFGQPNGIQVGQEFKRRDEMSSAYVHRPLQNGIHGTKREGADSIVVSGGYTDDVDLGDVILYTGHGGRLSGSRTQTFDQSPDDPGNAGMITSQIQGLPIRVIRGANKKSAFAPDTGYRYDGLYQVESSEIIRGSEGFLVIRFRLIRIDVEPAPYVSSPGFAEPAFTTTTITRRIRDSAISREIKKLYSFSCQICQKSIDAVGDRFYSEGAHVRPLGRPHSGDDSKTNLLSLCPNHHTQLDLGGMVIRDDLSVARRIEGEAIGKLTFAASHRIDMSNIWYHREWWTAAA